ncbi:MAG: alpha/beta fold hydrolase, partial [Bacteroidota bacterium]|nr:alpha/beta fold hydrolase [Bacteroidota bacterium]
PGSEEKGTVLFLHGYKGYMDWGAWALVGDHFASQGWRFLRINFSHNGTTPSRPSEFTDLDAFASNTYSRELNEATDVLRALRTPGSTEESQRVASMPLAVVGHSRGGGIACLAAAEADKALRERERAGVDSLVTWAAVADFGSRFPTGEELNNWKAMGRREIINHRTRQRLHHNWSFHEDFTTNEHRLHIESAVRHYPGRMLVAHSLDDAAVTVDHAERLSAWRGQSDLLLLEQGGHTFGASEPWTDAFLPNAMQTVTQTTLRFLEEGRAVQ